MLLSHLPVLISLLLLSITSYVIILSCMFNYPLTSTELHPNAYRMADCPMELLQSVGLTHRLTSQVLASNIIILISSDISGLSSCINVCNPANIRRWPSVGLLLGQCRRRWAISKPMYHVCWNILLFFPYFSHAYRKM